MIEHPPLPIQHYEGGIRILSCQRCWDRLPFGSGDGTGILQGWWSRLSTTLLWHARRRDPNFKTHELLFPSCLCELHSLGPFLLRFDASSMTLRPWLSKRFHSGMNRFQETLTFSVAPFCTSDRRPLRRLNVGATKWSAIDAAVLSCAGRSLVGSCVFKESATQIRLQKNIWGKEKVLVEIVGIFNTTQYD